MILLLYIVLNVLVLFYFFRYQKNNLHGLEVFVNWLVATILFQNYSALFYMNLKYFKIPEILHLELAHLLNRTVLIPVITLIFLNHLLSLKKGKNKFLFIVIFILLLGGIEWLAHVSGVLIHMNWTIWWSIVFWILFCFLSIVMMNLFRKKLLKEVPQS